MKCFLVYFMLLSSENSSELYLYLLTLLGLQLRLILRLMLIGPEKQQFLSQLSVSKLYTFQFLVFTVTSLLNANTYVTYTPWRQKKHKHFRFYLHLGTFNA